MPTRGRPLQPLVLTDEERTTLERWARRPKSPQSLALRSRIVLACATPGIANQTVAAALGVHPVSVGKWRSRFLTKRLDGLVDEPRPGAPRTVTDEHVEAVIVKTLQETPADATHWSTRSMARAAGMSQSAVSRIWRAFGLKPHLVDTFKLSADPLFVDKVRDVVGLYMNPRTTPSSSVSMRRPRSRRSIAPSRSFRCCQGSRNARATITSATARSTSTRR